MKDRLYTKNFLIILIGQLISIFGNSILRFALPLYILDRTGSTAVFGTVLAVSTIPIILFSPIGGILADRCNKRNIMVGLDMFTAFFLALGGIVIGGDHVLFVISAIMILLSLVQALYQPAVQACLPSITAGSNLEKANGAVSSVNAISSLLGPVVAGVLYGTFGIMPIIIIGAICFGLASVMELFIKIHFKQMVSKNSMFGTIASDLKESADYIFKVNPVLFRIIIVVSGINLTLTSMILVGLPVIIKINLELGSELYGITQGMIAVGMILGGLLAYSVGSRIRISRIHRLLVLICLTQIPIGLVLAISTSAMASYWIVSISSSVMMMLVTIFSIKMMSFVQRNTPGNIIGKVISFIMMMTRVTLPIGQAIYGYFFSISVESVCIIIFITVICSTGIALYSMKVFRGFHAVEGFTEDESDGSPYENLYQNKPICQRSQG